MDKKQAFKAGAAAATLMTVFLVALRSARLTSLDFEMMLGSLVTHSFLPSAWLFGLILHVILGGIIACAYAAGFEKLAYRDRGKAGLAFGFFHALLSGTMVMGIIPLVHPFLNGMAQAGFLSAPGPFAVHYGKMTPWIFIMLHLFYGAVVARLYKGVSAPLSRVLYETELPLSSQPQAV